MSHEKPNEFEQLVNLIEERINPYVLEIHERDSVRLLLQQFEFELLVECIYTSSAQYIRTNKKGEVTRESSKKFFDSLGGIATNKMLPPVKRSIKHVLSVGKKRCIGWKEEEAKQLLNYYEYLCMKKGIQEERIAEEIEKTWVERARNSKHWLTWETEIYIAIEQASK